MEDGIRLVGTLLNQEKIVFSAACVNTIKEFASYIWDAKAADRGEDAPIKQHDHAWMLSAIFATWSSITREQKSRTNQAMDFIKGR